MEIEQVNICDIQPYPNNPRKNEKAVDIVAKSIKNFGFLVPVILDDKNYIICGHTRIKAAIKLGMSSVPAIYAEGLTKEQINAYRIMDNKSVEYANWDIDLLKTELTDLKNAGFDLDLTGFSEVELSKFIDTNSEDNFEIPKEAKYKIEKGDIYQLGEHRLMCGDSTNEQMVTQLMNNEKAILMVTDPPYGVSYDPKWRDECDKKGILGNRYPTRSLGEVKNDDKIDWSDAYSLFKGDVMYVYHAGKYSSEVAESIKKVDFELINQIIWVKPHFALSRGDYHWRHEPLWYATRKGKQHNWQGSRKEDTVWEIAGMNAMGASHDKADEASGHGTQKPIECMKKPIKNNTSAGEGVYDPFGGSGSTLIACEQTNRKCYMMEIDESYCSVIIERWEKLTGKQAIKLNN